MAEGNLRIANRPGDSGKKPDYTSQPMKDHATPDPKKTVNVAKVLIVVGLAMLMIGAVITAIPMTWRSTQDLMDDWEGGDYGYYRTYDEGDTTKLAGEITFEISLDDILEDDVNYNEDDRNYYRALKNRGYNFAYLFDYIYGIEIYSKDDLGDIGDEVSLELTLYFWNLGGTEYWVWVGKTKERENAALHFTVGVAFIGIAVVLIFFGFKNYLAATRTKKPEAPLITERKDPNKEDPPRRPVYPPPPPPPAEGKIRNIETKKCPHCGMECLKGYGPCPCCGKEV